MRRAVEVLLAALLLLSCRSHEEPDEAPGPPPSGKSGALTPKKAQAKKPPARPREARRTEPRVQPGAIRLLDNAGHSLCSIEPSRGGDFNLRLPGKTLLLHLKGDELKLKRGDAVLLRVRRKPYGAKVEQADGKRLHQVKGKAGVEDSGWKLKAADGRTLFRVKRKGDGYELRKADKSLLAKLKKSGAREFSFKSAGGETHRVAGIDQPLAAVWLALEDLPIERRAALAVFFWKIYR